jgi:HPt (histidine-containing phosphotransfer) domain-containing protein
MDDYLAKPIDLDELRACVSDWLGPMDPAARRVAPATPEQEGREAMPVLEPKVLRELREVMGDDYLSLLWTYLRNAPQLLAQARAAVTQSDVGSMVIPMHSLKSSSANVGAMHLSDLAREAERHARAGDFAAAEAAFNAVDIAFNQADAALREHIDGLSAA